MQRGPSFRKDNLQRYATTILQNNFKDHTTDCIKVLIWSLTGPMINTDIFLWIFYSWVTFFVWSYVTVPGFGTGVSYWYWYEYSFCVCYVSTISHICQLYCNYFQDQSLLPEMLFLWYNRWVSALIRSSRVEESSVLFDGFYLFNIIVDYLLIVGLISCP